MVCANFESVFSMVFLEVHYDAYAFSQKQLFRFSQYVRWNLSIPVFLAALGLLTFIGKLRNVLPDIRKIIV